MANSDYFSKLSDGKSWEIFDLVYPEKISVETLIKDITTEFPGVTVHPADDGAGTTVLEIFFLFSSKKVWNGFFRRYFYFLADRNLLDTSFWMDMERDLRSTRMKECLDEYAKKAMGALK